MTAPRSEGTGGPKGPLLSVNNIEVIYDHVILVLKGVSLAVPEGKIVTLLGANGAGKTTTLKAISNLLETERGAVTKGTIEFAGERVDNRTPRDLVRRGVVQVMEGRHCFGHLTVEENLLTGAFARHASRSEIRRDLERIYEHFPQLAAKQAPFLLDTPVRRLPAALFPRFLDGAARMLGEAAWRYMQWTRRDRPDALARVAYVRATMRPYTLFDGRG